MAKIGQPQIIFLLINLIVYFLMMPCSYSQIIQNEKIDQKIQEVIQSNDKDETAKRLGLFYQNGKLRVHLIFSPQITIEEKEKIYSTYKIQVEKESDQVVRTLIPIEEIMPLGENPLIQFIQIPDKPLPLNSGGRR